MKHYLVLQKSRGDEPPDWFPSISAPSEFTDRDEAKAAFVRVVDLWGHTTRHRLVEVRIKVLEEH